MVWCLMKQRDSTILIYFCTPYFTFLFFTSSVLVKITQLNFILHYFLLLWPKYLPLYLILKQPQSMFLPNYERPNFTPLKARVRLVFPTYFKHYFLDSNWENANIFYKMVSSIPQLKPALISISCQFWFVSVIPKYLNFATFPKDLLVFCKLWFCPIFCWWDMNILSFTRACNHW